MRADDLTKMPFLHWETDQRRAKAAAVSRKTMKGKLTTLDDVVEESSRLKSIVETTIERVNSDGLLETIKTIVETPRPKPSDEKITSKSHKGMKLLGKLLLLAAGLAEAMDSYTDEKLIERYLTARPALHPRRTLDQSYYWTLKDTRYRDRDQVVYRGTVPARKHLHSNCRKTNPKPRGDIPADPPCVQCTENVRKVPRIVMVDQLWMWILDESQC